MVEEDKTPAFFRNPDTPSYIVEVTTIAFVYGSILQALIAEGRVPEQHILNIMASQGSDVYQNRLFRRLSRELGLTENQRQASMAEAFVNARNLLLPPSEAGDPTNG